MLRQLQVTEEFMKDSPSTIWATRYRSASSEWYRSRYMTMIATAFWSSSGVKAVNPIRVAGSSWFPSSK
jgi:hypothetical protein